MEKTNLVPAKRTALDGRVWWVVFDDASGKYSTLLCFGRYKTRKAAQIAICCAQMMGHC